MKELDEAMRLSSEDVTLSSAEIVPCQTSASGLDRLGRTGHSGLKKDFFRTVRLTKIHGCQY